MKGKVIIVGAGPGDPDLITVKGLRALKKADVVIYDRLIPNRLLRKVKKDAELIFVGKEPYKSHVSQGRIIQLMVQKAKEGRLVVRLKGGDPMVLGRGGEEILELAKAGIEFEVVPGVTSAIAAATSAFVPVTFRGISSSVTITTGMEDLKKRKRFVDFRKVAKLDNTIIILMGTKKLREIRNELIEGGLSPKTPIAIIENAFSKKQRVIEGVLEDIVEMAEKQLVNPPTVIIVGEVIRIRRRIMEMIKNEGDSFLKTEGSRQ